MSESWTTELGGKGILLLGTGILAIVVQAIGVVVAWRRRDQPPRSAWPLVSTIVALFAVPLVGTGLTVWSRAVTFRAIAGVSLTLLGRFPPPALGLLCVGSFLLAVEAPLAGFGIALVLAAGRDPPTRRSILAVSLATGLLVVLPPISTVAVWSARLYRDLLATQVALLDEDRSRLIVSEVPRAQAALGTAMVVAGLGVATILALSYVLLVLRSGAEGAPRPPARRFGIVLGSILSLAAISAALASVVEHDNEKPLRRWHNDRDSPLWATPGVSPPEGRGAASLETAPLLTIASTTSLLDGQLLASADSIGERLDGIRKRWGVLQPNVPFPDEIVLEADVACPMERVARFLTAARAADYVIVSLAFYARTTSCLPPHGALLVGRGRIALSLLLPNDPWWLMAENLGAFSIVQVLHGTAPSGWPSNHHVAIVFSPQPRATYGDLAAAASEAIRRDFHGLSLEVGR